MTKTLILICLSAVDPAACTRESALLRLRGPDATLQQCAFSAEAMLAADPDPILGPRYAKVVCERLEAMR